MIEIIFWTVIIVSVVYAIFIPPRPIRYKLEKCQFGDKLCPKQYILDDYGFRVENQLSCCKFKRQLDACKRLEEIMINERSI